MFTNDASTEEIKLLHFSSLENGSIESSIKDTTDPLSIDSSNEVRFLLKSYNGIRILLSYSVQ